jgi:hypothetical protein
MTLNNIDDLDDEATDDPEDDDYDHDFVDTCEACNSDIDDCSCDEFTPSDACLECGGSETDPQHG